MKKKYWISLLVAVVLVVAGVYVWAGANQKTEAEPNTSINVPAPQPAQPIEVPTKASYSLSQLSTMFVQYKDRHVTVSGQYGGWSHACPASQGKTRSDWVLFDGTSCLFVTGAMPKGLNTLKPNNEAVEVVGVLRETEGKYYLEGSQVNLK